MYFFTLYFNGYLLTGEILVSRNLDTGLVPPTDPNSVRQFQDVTYVVQVEILSLSLSLSFLIFILNSGIYE